jgi:tRNA modification GTPase TrmE
VIRVSGDRTKDALKALTGSDAFKPRYATYKKIHDPVTKDVIDNGLVLYFPSPKSFTGEDSCEFQVHGGTAVVTALLKALGKVKGLRPSEPGEFSKRAFLNGKIDLTAAEGIADLIHAETEMQRKQALIHAEGHLSRVYQDWRHRIIHNMAHIEAYIDFSEDEHIEDNVLSEVYKNLIQLKHELQKHLSDGRMGERLREGVRVVIVGETNVGKSSLMNILTQRDVSIVTSIAGTTRDIIETSFEINGR